MNYLKPATGASLVVAQKAPDKWIEFHHALLAYFRTQFQAGNGTVVQNLDPSWKQVKQIATEVGVPSDVVATFPVNAVESYLEASSNAWKDAQYSGRQPNQLGTPEFVKDHSSVVTLGKTVESTRESLKELFGFADSATQAPSDLPSPRLPCLPGVTRKRRRVPRRRQVLTESRTEVGWVRRIGPTPPSYLESLSHGVVAGARVRHCHASRVGYK